MRIAIEWRGRFALLLCASACLGSTLLCTPANAQAREVKVKHIVVLTKAEIDTIHKELLAGEVDRKAFSTAAKKYSKDPASKRLGGTLPEWVSPTRTGYDPAFKDAALKLGVGDLSEPVKSDFGWHLIYAIEERGGGTATTVVTPSDVAGNTGTTETPAGAGTPKTTGTSTVGPQSLVPAGAGSDGTDTTTSSPQTTVEVLAPREPKKFENAKRSTRPAKKLIVSVSSSKVGNRAAQYRFSDRQMAELNVSIKNGGSEVIQSFAPELAVLGFDVTGLGDSFPLLPDFASLAEPASFFVELKPYEIRGYEFALNEFYPDLREGRYSVRWNRTTFFTKLESRFPKVTELAEYATIKSALQASGATQVDNIVRDALARQTMRDGGLNVSLYESIRSNRAYLVDLKLSGIEEPIRIQLDTRNQLSAARHFANLVADGFYDNLDFFDVRAGDFLLGGSPTPSGNGVPNVPLPRVRNVNNLSHVRGTVSFVSRRVRKGPIRGGEIGSVFFICLKSHPEWDAEHVPFGKVVSGLDQLSKLIARTRIEWVKLLPSDGDASAIAASPDASSRTAAGASTPGVTTGNPEAVIKTAKGELTVELFEDDARNTVNNFVSLADAGFYNKLREGEGKQTFHFLLKDEGGKPLAIQGGSPTNDFEGGPGYTVTGESNEHKHTKGALALVRDFDEETGAFVSDSGGSQFLICLDDIPYYDTMKLTVFGRVTRGLEVLDKLEEGDAIESINVTKKRPKSSYTVRKHVPGAPVDPHAGHNH